MNAHCQIMRGNDMARKPPRPVPEDFEIIFVEQGRLACETWYRCRRTTVDRWLIECGKQRLIDKRAAYVRSLRRQGRWITRSTRLVEHRETRKTTGQTIRDRRRIRPTVARAAANYLRTVDKWVVVKVADGEWIVGTRRKSAAEMVEMAERKGFDRRKANSKINQEGE